MYYIKEILEQQFTKLKVFGNFIKQFFFKHFTNEACFKIFTFMHINTIIPLIS